MKILKILFLGIVLVVFNLTYLAAANLPDSLLVKAGLAKPGGTLDLTVDIRMHSPALGGLILTLEGVPEDFDTTAGAWYTWSALGTTLSTSATATLVKLEEGILNISIVGVNIDQFLQFGIIPSGSGDLITFHFGIPADMAEGTITLTAVAEGNLMMPWPVTNPAFTEFPVVEIEPIVVANIPDYNALQLTGSLMGVSGGTLVLPVNVENKDEFASGSFKVGYDDAVLTLTGVTAGARGTGMTFTIGSSALAAAATKTVSFTGGAISAGGLGVLCNLNFSVAKVSAGATSTVTLSSVSLLDSAGAALDSVIQPTTAATGLSFVYGDSLFVDVKTGAHQVGSADEASGISVIENGQLRVPIRLKNTSPVTVLRFYIKEETGKEDLLSFNEIENTARTTSWTAPVVADSGSYIQVIAYAGSISSPLAAGDGAVYTIVYDIADTVGVPPQDIELTLGCVEVVDDSDNLLGVELIKGVATIDFRVPSGKENVAPGAALPKAFALAQNHPNPFNPSTTINYQIPDDVNMVSFTLNIFDLRGKLVKTLAKGVSGPGYYSAFWDGTDQNGRQVSSGIYFYRFASDKYTQTRKMILLK
ncbi:MAG TPA: FlgD immunoglobulin-like domain containing protein [archaeon]|nr:FlgD immunoglobulin-like domain containing protein [archaeon]